MFFNGSIRYIGGFFNIVTQIEEGCGAINKDWWYLDTLAVEKTHQGQGLGSHMLNFILKIYIAKRGGGVLSLMTNTTLNRAFYLKNGFSEYSACVVEYKERAMPNWLFTRHIAPLNE